MKDNSFGALLSKCKSLGYKVNGPNKHGLWVITKKRAAKLIIRRSGMCEIQKWDARRNCYATASPANVYIRHVPEIRGAISHSSVIEPDIAKRILQTLEEIPTAPKSSGEYKVDKLTFGNTYVYKFSNGFVSVDLVFNEVIISGVVHINKNGVIAPIETGSQKDPWFLIEGRSKCTSACKGVQVQILYDGNRFWVPLERTRRVLRVSPHRSFSLSSLDKALIDAAMRLFLDRQENEEGKRQDTK